MLQDWAAGRVQRSCLTRSGWGWGGLSRLPLKLCPRQSKSRNDFKADNRNTNPSSLCLKAVAKN